MPSSPGMHWWILGSYLLAGLIAGVAMVVYCIRTKREGPIDTLIFASAIAPDFLLLILLLPLWPIILPVIYFLPDHLRPSFGGDFSIPTQVRTNLVNREGIVEKDLRPSGTISIDDAIYEATSTQGFISSGTQVTVTDQDSLRLSVQPISESSPTTETP
jgi:membrane protein implicated in regulation of membrane protease activity